MPLLIRVSLILLSLTCLTIANDINLDLEYSVDANRYNSYGKLLLRQLSDGNYTGSIKLTAGINENLLKNLKESASKNGLFYLKSGDLLTSNSACLLLRSNLKQVISVSVDQERGAVESLTVFPDGIYDTGIAAFDCTNYVVEGNPTLSTKVLVNLVHELPVPDAVAYLKRLEEEKRARQHGASQDNRSFLAKYWMYIVPVVIFMVVSSAMGGEEGAPAS